MGFLLPETEETRARLREKEVEMLRKENAALKRFIIEHFGGIAVYRIVEADGEVDVRWKGEIVARQTNQEDA